MNLNKGEFNNEQEEFIVNKLEVIKILMLWFISVKLIIFIILWKIVSINKIMY